MGLDGNNREIAEILINKNCCYNTLFEQGCSILKTFYKYYCRGWQFLGHHTENTGLSLVWLYCEKKLVLGVICGIAK